jgi:hypothetical protein
MTPMRRAPILLAALLLAGCGAAESVPVEPARPAEPQQVELGWRERYPPTGPGLRFSVDKLVVHDEGWSAEVGVTNTTGISFELDRSRHQFGLMLFASGDLGELEAASRNGTLPAPRLATSLRPDPPEVLGPGESWRATISAPGALADGSFVRVVFGPFTALGDPPEGMEPVVSWITDRSHRL